MNTRKIVLATFVAGLAACGGGGGGGPTGPSSDDVRGSYTVVHSFIFVSGASITLTCNGSLDVTAVAGQAFTGTVTIEPCVNITTTRLTGPLSGTLTSGGAVTLTITGLVTFVQGTTVQGCTIVSVEDRYAGTFNGNRLTASLDATAQCDIGQIAITHQIAAQRT